MKSSPVVTSFVPAIIVSAMMFVLAQGAIAQQPMITMDQFDRWIFNRMSTEDKARESLKSRIDLEIAHLERIASLTEEQKSMIRLAGKGDIKRFFDDVHVARRKFIELGDVNQNQVNEAYQLASPLAQRLSAGLFGPESLLKKVAATVPGPEQAALIRAREIARRKSQTKVAIKTYVALLGRRMPLSASQREQLINLIEEKVELKNPMSRYSTQVIDYRLSQLPEEPIREIVDENQWDVLEKSFSQAVAMKAMLKQQGELDDD